MLLSLLHLLERLHQGKTLFIFLKINEMELNHIDTFIPIALQQRQQHVLLLDGSHHLRYTTKKIRMGRLIWCGTG